MRRRGHRTVRIYFLQPPNAGNVEKYEQIYGVYKQLYKDVKETYKDLKEI